MIRTPTSAVLAVLVTASAAAAQRPNTVFLDELTWTEVRAAIDEGVTTIIVPTAGTEQNGPHMVLGKHKFIINHASDLIARELGNALVAPVIAYVPEGAIDGPDGPTGHMRYAGAITLPNEHFMKLLEYAARSLDVHGFTDIVFIGDSGGNVQGMANVAARLNERWDDAHAHHIPEYYRYGGGEFLESELGIVETENDGIHDSFGITSLMMTVDPTVVRYEQRVKAGLAKINGVPIAPKEETIKIGLKLRAYRTALTVEKVRESIANAGM